MSTRGCVAAPQGRLQRPEYTKWALPNDRAFALMGSMTRNSRAGSDRDRGITPPARWALTSAEVRVVQTLATGLRPSEMATTLGLSVHTVRTHLKRAMVKAGVHSQAALVARVYSSGTRD
jgi:DNA-binding CsgD family transcriptional regulator